MTTNCEPFLSSLRYLSEGGQETELMYGHGFDLPQEKVQLCQIGHLERGDPLDLAERMGRVALKLPKAVVWGGCCGTWDEHLDVVAKTVLANSL